MKHSRRRRSRTIESSAGDLDANTTSVDDGGRRASVFSVELHADCARGFIQTAGAAPTSFNASGGVPAVWGDSERGWRGLGIESVSAVGCAPGLDIPIGCMCAVRIPVAFRIGRRRACGSCPTPPARGIIGDNNETTRPESRRSSTEPPAIRTVYSAPTRKVRGPSAPVPEFHEIRRIGRNYLDSRIIRAGLDPAPSFPERESAKSRPASRRPCERDVATHSRGVGRVVNSGPRPCRAESTEAAKKFA